MLSAVYDPQTQTVSPEQRRLFSQIHQYERETFKIQVLLALQGKEVAGYAHSISPEGLLVFSDATLSPGTPMALEFFFDDSTCSLNISGHVLFCRLVTKEQSTKQAIGIGFSGVGNFEQKILICAVSELKQNAAMHEKSFLTILASDAALDQEAAGFSAGFPQPLKGGLKKKPRRPSLKKDKGIIAKRELFLEKEQFLFHKTLYLTDTNALGNAYFARYFDWQGMAREEFLKRLTPNPLAFFQAGYKILTVSAHMEYKHEILFYDEIEIEIKTDHIKKVSLDIIFIFKNKKTEQIMAIGGQTLMFVNAKGKPALVPNEMRNNMLKYRREEWVFPNPVLG